MPLVGLVLVDEMHHVDRAAVGRFFGKTEQWITFEQIGRDVSEQLLYETRVLPTICEHAGNRPSERPEYRSAQRDCPTLQDARLSDGTRRH
jgi:hypothetical protein